MQAILDHLASLPTWMTYGVIAGLVFSEAALFVGFVLPGETAVLLGGFLASTGHLSILTLCLVTVLAAIIGDSVGFEVGRHLGPRLLNARPLRRHRAKLDNAQAYLRKRGGAALVLSRWTAFLRAVMPALAGASAIRYPTFLLYNVIGGTTWALTCCLGGYFAGHSYQAVATRMGQASAVIIGLLVIGALWAWHRRRKVAA